MILSWLKKRHRRRLLAAPFPPDWLDHLDKNVAAYAMLTETEQARLRDDLRIFVAEKTWAGCGGLTMRDEIKVTIAAQACLLLLGIEHDYFSRVRTILVYPAGYRPAEGEIGPGGIVHEDVGRLGEAWYRGPVVLSWESVQSGGQNARDGRNVVLHEFAHQLDFLDGWIDGTPPLTSPAQYHKWHDVMTAEYERLVKESGRNKVTLLDVYGATNPAEFFAVATECFFEKPLYMERQHPRLYEVLREYFRQDTAARFKRRPETAASRGSLPNAMVGLTPREEKKEGPTTMRCPRDGATLKTQSYEADIQVDVCPSCRGMWLDKGKLEHIQETVERDYSKELAAIPKKSDPSAQARQREGPNLTCPRCGRPMLRKEHPSCSQVLIDVCAGCEGIWLDQGEIEELEQAYERAQTEVEGFRKGFFASLTHLFPLYGIGTIKAQFVRKADGKPISGASGQYSVKLYDKDPLRDDELGAPRLDAEGRVQCTFDLYDIVSADSPLERKPDLYLVLYERDKEVFRTPVFWNLDFEKRDVATGKTTAVTYDLGTFAV
jgi:Mlc titration factor MtfA (ptsG expression regulator)/Zn-finger nucleic acid-binding protein